MTEEQFRNLKRGDIVRHKTAAESYVVDWHNGRQATAVRTAYLTNPTEWDLIPPERGQ
jgi:hypothetical protein